MRADDTPLHRALRALTPDARAALRRALAAAQDRPYAQALAAELVNTEVEETGLPLDPALVRRAAAERARAPMVRVAEGEDYALLVSPEHVWTLADRVDELEVALQVLATALAHTDPERLRELLDNTDAAGLP